MLETWIFMSGFLIVSLLALFHGLVLMIAPDKSIPVPNWGPRRIELFRKPPLDLGKRFAGLCWTLLVSGVFIRPVILWMIHPTPGTASLEDSPVVVRWDFLGLGVFALAAGIYLLRRPDGPVRHMFAADATKLKDRATLRLWTLYTQAAGVFCVLFSVLILNQFLRSLR